MPSVQLGARAAWTTIRSIERAMTAKEKFIGDGQWIATRSTWMLILCEWVAKDKQYALWCDAHKGAMCNGKTEDWNGWSAKEQWEKQIGWLIRSILFAMARRSESRSIAAGRTIMG